MPWFQKDPDCRKVKKITPKYYAVWVDFSNQLRRLPLFEDRKASEEMSRKIDRMNDLRAAGETLPPELSRFVETMPPRIREKLAKWDILPKSRVAASKPLVLHLEDWNRSLLVYFTTNKRT
jgi:hypothetical protein